MENKLEQLLNSLIEKGFIPFNIPEITEIKYISTKNKLRITSHQNNRNYKDDFSLRDIVSKESGLWQFVCENEMVKIEYGKIREKYDETSPTTDKNKIITYRQLLGEDNYEYRLIESALCDEDKLEEFLLSNIKVDE